MARKLIVTGAFGDRQRGDEITDPAEVEAALAEHAAHVVAVQVDDAAPAPPAPTPPPAAAKTDKPAADDPGALA